MVFLPLTPPQGYPIIGPRNGLRQRQVETIVGLSEEDGIGESGVKQGGMNVRVGLAWAVHVYTSLGLVCAGLGVRALLDDRVTDVFLWLAVAFVIDATDGVLARQARVQVHTPHFSGGKLDDIADYLNYTFIPVCLIYQQQLLPDAWAPVLGLVLIASAYGFCSDAAKTPDGFFTGFPSYWNVVALYLYFLRPPDVVAAGIVVLFALMTFWPVRYLYPTRNPEGRRIALSGGVLWAMACVWLIRHPDPPLVWIYLSLLYPAWYLAFSFYLHFRRA